MRPGTPPHTKVAEQEPPNLRDLSITPIKRHLNKRGCSSVLVEVPHSSHATKQSLAVIIASAFCETKKPLNNFKTFSSKTLSV